MKRGIVFVAAGLIGMSQAYASDRAKEPEAVPGEYIVKLRDQVPLSAFDRQALSYQLRSWVKDTIPSYNIAIIKRPTFELQASAIRAVAALPEVEYVEPNYIYRVKRLPNDPMLNQLWGIRNFGQKDSSGVTGVAGVDVAAEAAWNISTGDPNLVVAVIDTGVDYNNPDLRPNMWVNELEARGQKGVDDDGNGYVDDVHGFAFDVGAGITDPMDDHGHGTHCAGTIGAKGDDGRGIVGVVWNTKIMAVKFLSAAGSGTLEGALKSIDYAVRNGAKVLSNSWGGGGYSQSLKEAIERSLAAGAVFVAAAGNESNDNDANPTYPATYDIPNVISVAAIDNKGRLASFSNYGKKRVHVAAPGVNVLSTTTSGYESWSGTSMATPHVSGVVALLLSVHPQLKAEEVRHRLIQTASRVGGLRTKVASGGIVNAIAAIEDRQPAPDPNDPSNWKTVAFRHSSAHPYPNKAKQRFTIKIPGVQGVKRIALYFERFETERNYDILKIKDAKGSLVEELSGNNNDSFSAVIEGDTAVLEFISDGSINYYGWDITKIAYQD
ncbi:MAG: S8 family serine peptidase [Bdellovibrionaceae bacterium]|nr:S8 family serine peptidase [Pseudobdellovibrionaceae bacterium]